MTRARTAREGRVEAGDLGGVEDEVPRRRVGAGPLRASRLRDGEDAFVSNVSTVPDCVRRGIAQSLLAEALAHARQRSRTMSLQVDRRAPALALYRRLGFEPVSEEGDTLTLRLHFAERSEAPSTPSASSGRPSPL